MLISLRIENIALVHETELSFYSGLSVLSGETGAGKSIIVTALSLALGERADKELIRSGESRGAVEAVFDIAAMPAQYRKDFADYIDNGKLKILREIYATGTSKVKLNGIVSTVSRLREISSPLAEIMGQHSNQMLMNEENHLLFLDSFAALDSLREEVSLQYREWQRVRKQLDQLRRERDNLTHEREHLMFQKVEIDGAKVVVGEEEQLVRRKKLLDSSRTLADYSEVVRNMLENDEGSVSTYLKQARSEFEKMAEIDDTLSEQVKEFADLDFRVEEMRQFIEKYGSTIPDDQDDLEEINERLKELFELKRKYGGSEQSIIDTLNTINRGLEDRPDVDGRISEIEKECNLLRDEYSKKALSLSSVRRKAATYLQKLVLKELNELAIDAGGFEFEFLYEDDPDGIILDGTTVKAQEYGLEKGRFLFSANSGEPLKSLVRTASGGEISRVLLALKAAEKKNNNLQSVLLVFDEVDTGIGGKTANEVGQKLLSLASNCQVLVITHLHQIARLANTHYLALKEPQHDARKAITVVQLDQDSIQSELDRMVALPEESHQR